MRVMPGSQEGAEHVKQALQRRAIGAALVKGRSAGQVGSEPNNKFVGGRALGGRRY